MKWIEKNLLSDFENEVSTKLAKELGDIMIEALKRKGFEFENRADLAEFIKSNCRCEDRCDIKQRTYFVNDAPFFLHDYNMSIKIKDDGEIFVSDGFWAYL